MKHICLTLLFSLLTPQAAGAVPIVVVGKNIQNLPLNKNELRRIFLGTDSTIGQTHIELILPKSNSETLKTFCSESLKMKPDQFQRYWLRRVLSGQSIAPKQLSSKEAFLFIDDHPNAIAVIESTEVPEAKGLQIFQ